MSAKHSFSTADYLPWDTATSLVRKLYRDEDYRMSLLIGCGIFFGLRISDILNLTWESILNASDFYVHEQKTGKRRHIKIDKGFAGHIADCYHALSIQDIRQHCFLNRYGDVISVQMINRKLKDIRALYQLKIEHFSTHTLRKTWARRIWEMENSRGRGEQALTVLSELMNHSSPAITRRYICLRQQELSEVWGDLCFV